MKNRYKLIAVALASALFITSCGTTIIDKVPNDKVTDKGDLEIIEDNIIDTQDDNKDVDKGEKPTNDEKPADDKDKNPEEDKEEKPANEDQKGDEDDQKDEEEGKIDEIVNTEDDQRDDLSAQIDIVKRLKVGQTIYIDSEVNAYSNANDATHWSNEVTTYPAGTYYIFKIVDNVINISLAPGEPGGWINPLDTRITENAPVGNNTNDNKTLTGEAYSWSWLYPESSGSEVLEANNGVYTYKDNNIYLTFDNGYEYKTNTSKILDVLKSTGVKATFFITSDFLKSHTDVVKRMVNEGHLVGNHSEKHLNHSAVSKDAVYTDLANWESDFKSLIGSLPNTKAYRPPEGKFSDISLDVAQNLGYKTVLWAYAYKDWDTSNQPDVRSSLSTLLENNKGGNVLLLHAVSDTNVALLEDYINQTKVQGLNFSLIR
ncbi:MAG: polysaccharide deacetylase family protein [Tissierellia bacterium]|nr:polysaccharide deacetylase family protein [Tissierellia bacterium]